MPGRDTRFEAVKDFLSEPLRIGEPDLAGPLAVFPILGPEPQQQYAAFAHAREQGVKVLESEEHASVNNLVIENPTDEPVLLYEGEEVTGAQQNRILDKSILVPAATTLEIPVSCVEQHRWDVSRRDDELSSSPHAAYPKLRRMKAARKATRLKQQVAALAEARADQLRVWGHVASKSERHGVSSPSRAMHDIYEGRRSALEAITAAIRVHPGQVGAIARIGGKMEVLDYVSRSEVFEALHGPLVRGYALDALEAEGNDARGIEPARGFALLVTDCVIGRRTRSVGLGDDLRFASNVVVGSALAVDGELVQLTAFPAVPGG